jgi:hypothetical protein
MAVNINGLEMATDSKSFIINNVEITEIIANDVSVWKYDEAVTPPPDEAPGEINNFTVTDGLGEVTLSWDYVTGYPIPTYYIFEDGVQVADALTSRTYTRVVSKGTREYAVAAYNGVGDPTSTSELTGISGELPTVTNLSASDGLEGKVTITWDYDTGYPLPTSAKVYRGATLISSNAVSPYNDIPPTADTTYIYKVVFSNEFATDV